MTRAPKPFYDAVQVPRDRAKWPQKLFFYERGAMTPSFSFTRRSRTAHWVGHGVYSMSRQAIERWVERQAFRGRL